ncbi:MAG: hypothetical protein HQ536_03560 [Parcubacteria group bacterium]|nr:hypothetical protein [Parcubacteria group bacterium]
MKKTFILILLLFVAVPVLAHQPRIVSEDFVEIKNPEVSQAFYGEMSGRSIEYQIKSDLPFNLYVGILVPDLEGVEKDISVNIFKNEELLFYLDGENFKWERYFEEHGGDYYYKGPENRIEQVDAGTYKIKVFSTDNKGKYVLVVGDKEEFPVSEIINTLKTLPKLKADFFEKSPLLAFFNVVGLYLAVFLLVVLGIIVIIFWVIKRLRKNNENHI